MDRNRARQPLRRPAGDLRWPGTKGSSWCLIIFQAESESKLNQLGCWKEGEELEIQGVINLY